MNPRAIGLSQCPVPRCRFAPVPWFCELHWPFVSPGLRRRIVRFTLAMRGGNGLREVPPTLAGLLAEAVREIETTNVADRLALAVHALVVGASP